MRDNLNRQHPLSETPKEVKYPKEVKSISLDNLDFSKRKYRISVTTFWGKGLTTDFSPKQYSL